MRLINAEKLIEKTERDFCYPEAYKKMVEEEPTAYDLDAVIQQLEGLRDEHIDMQCCPYVDDDEMSCVQCYMKKAIEIVKSGGQLCGEGSI